MNMGTTIEEALPVRSVSFSFLPEKKDEASTLQTSFRLRGSLGLSLKKQCCHFDAHKTPCDGCSQREFCHYGQSFEAPTVMRVTGLGNLAGSVPHAWGLAINKQGIRVLCTLTLAGKEQVWLASWQRAIEDMGLNIRWEEAEESQPFSLQWQSLTPVRLRHQGKTPQTELDIAKAICSSVVQKSKLLAILHGKALPDARLNPPTCSDKQWFEEERYAFRYQKKQKLGGWMVNIDWGTVHPDWLAWLKLAHALGVGRQTSFGLGRFVMVKNS